jgi:cytochrome b561
MRSLREGETAMLLNTPQAYGGLTKALHWSIAAIFAFQLGSGLVMTRLAQGQVVLRLGGDAWYNWHKTWGLAALLLAVARLLARRAGTLPDWADCLTAFDKRLVHRAEQLLYLGMFLMPLSGLLHVMAGGYGVQFAGLWALPNPLPRIGWLAAVGAWGHVATGIMLAVALAGHLLVVGRHLPRGLLRRMLPRG